MSARPENYFPVDYRSARGAFLKACAAAGLSSVARVHPTAKARDGKPLFLDTATIGARDAEAALLLISGTHGAEGYFGSGVQTGLLREGLMHRVPKAAKVVLLHALNPYGFSWARRVDDENADINRNFVDHANPPANKAYEALADAIAPKDISPETLRAANARLRAYPRRLLPRYAGLEAQGLGGGERSPPRGTGGSWLKMRRSLQNDGPLVYRIGQSAPVAQLDRVLPSEGRGHRFESCRVRHFRTKLGTDPKRLGSDVYAAMAARGPEMTAVSRFTTISDTSPRT